MFFDGFYQNLTHCVCLQFNLCGFSRHAWYINEHFFVDYKAMWYCVDIKFLKIVCLTRPVNWCWCLSFYITRYNSSKVINQFEQLLKILSISHSIVPSLRKKSRISKIKKKLWDKMNHGFPVKHTDKIKLYPSVTNHREPLNRIWGRIGRIFEVGEGG